MSSPDPKDKSRQTHRRKWLNCFVPHRLEMLLSPAWQSAPRPLRRMIERLEIEHLRHGGLKNGELFVSFNQFVEFGISRRSIKPAQTLGKALGLLDVVQDHNLAQGSIRAPNAYRLTYVPAAGATSPSDDWRGLTKARVESLISAFKANEDEAPRVGKKRAA
ncbi:MAG: hypothetical protein ABS35_15485 [Kaistia sp. SCN 65-12]|nr:MAG: hypothetical protein ABS35_15485 [Kaistia sp. SCN 65-12]